MMPDSYGKCCDEIIRLRQQLVDCTRERDKLRAALIGLCSEDAPCDCDDWMVTPTGTKCAYCNAKAALAGEASER